MENLFFPEFTHRIVLRHREMGIKSQWKMYRNAEHGFFYTLTRACQREAFHDIVLFMEGGLETVIPEKLARYPMVDVEPQKRKEIKW